jgi:hypothetical protein
MVKENHLDSKEDIFYLTLDEVKFYCIEKSSSFKHQVVERKKNILIIKNYDYLIELFIIRMKNQTLITTWKILHVTALIKTKY